MVEITLNLGTRALSDLEVLVRMGIVWLSLVCLLVMALVPLRSPYHR